MCERPALINSIVFVSAQTYCTLFHCVYDFKYGQMNIQRNLIRQLLLDEFEQGHNIMKDSKNI